MCILLCFYNKPEPSNINRRFLDVFEEANKPTFHIWSLFIILLLSHVTKRVLHETTVAKKKLMHLNIETKYSLYTAYSVHLIASL